MVTGAIVMQQKPYNLSFPKTIPVLIKVSLWPFVISQIESELNMIYFFRKRQTQEPGKTLCE